MGKKIICLLTAATLFLLCACEKKTGDDGPKPWAAPSTQTAVTQETEATRQEEMETMEAMTEKVGNITLPMGVKATDIELLEKIIWAQFFVLEFDRETATPEETMYYLSSDNVSLGIFFILKNVDPDGKLGTCEQIYISEKADPKDKFGFTYFKIEESAVDFLLTDMFGVKADHNLQTDYYYNENGYWYFCCDPAGVEGYETHARACQTLENGHYRITMENIYQDMDGASEHAGSAFVEAAVREKDGFRYWEIYKVETFE